MSKETRLTAPDQVSSSLRPFSGSWRCRGPVVHVASVVPSYILIRPYQRVAHKNDPTGQSVGRSVGARTTAQAVREAIAVSETLLPDVGTRLREAAHGLLPD